MAEVILFYPKTGSDIKPSIAPPHPLLAIAAMCDKAGYDVKIVDQRLSSNWRAELQGELAREPLVFGITAMTGVQIYHAIEAAKVVRANGNTPIVWGGKHATIMPEQTLESEWCDLVCIGEGDFTFCEIVNSIAGKLPLSNVKGIAYKDGGKVVKTAGRVLATMDDLPETPWHLIDVEDYVHPDMYLAGCMRAIDIGQTSRGCPFSCGFCSQGGTKYRAMSVEKAVGVIREAVERFGVDGIWIRDDEFYVKQKRVAEICEGILPLGVKWYTSGTRIDIFNKTPEDQLLLYKASGADTIKFGAESGNNRVLEYIGKKITVEDTISANLKCKKLGISPTYNLVAGFPTETLEETRDTVDMALRIKADNPKARFETIFLYTPFPGTPLWGTALEYGLEPPETLEDWADWQFEEYDDEGKRLPWYNAKEREARGNLCYLTSLTQVVPSLIVGFNGDPRGKLFKAAYWLPYRYFDFRFRHKLYGFMPEMKLIRWARKMVFDKSGKTIR